MPVQTHAELLEAQAEANDLELILDRSRGLAMPGVYGDEMFVFAQAENQARLDVLTKEIARYYRNHGPSVPAPIHPTTQGEI